MITYNNNSFESQKEFHNYLLQNKKLLITQKKSAIKYADSLFCESIQTINKNIESVTKGIDSENEIFRALVLNTTRYKDSHKDVHIDNLWKKTIKENKNLFLLQEHQMSFDKMIADSEDIDVYTQNFTWQELGYDAFGFTEALMFYAKIQKAVNPFMFEKYLQNKVKNHSVGMQYVKIALALNNRDAVEEYKTFNQYYDMIANKKEVDEDGMFWAVTEAKLFEGSAVMRGSNPITPTLNNKEE
jgi:hypothetical protein